MLDNVLDATVWPLPQQQQEAMAKRRIGLGFTGLAWISTAQALANGCGSRASAFLC